MAVEDEEGESEKLSSNSLSKRGGHSGMELDLGGSTDSSDAGGMCHIYIALFNNQYSSVFPRSNQFNSPARCRPGDCLAHADHPAACDRAIHVFNHSCPGVANSE